MKDCGNRPSITPPSSNSDIKLWPKANTNYFHHTGKKIKADKKWKGALFMKTFPWPLLNAVPSLTYFEYPTVDVVSHDMVWVSGALLYLEHQALDFLVQWEREEHEGARSHTHYEIVATTDCHGRRDFGMAVRRSRNRSFDGPTTGNPSRNLTHSKLDSYSRPSRGTTWE